jgi:hypothetical protein
METNLHLDIADYYSRKLAEHGDTPLGVDWNGKQSQYTRFAQLCKIFGPGMDPISINDLGCGYGAMLDYIFDKYDISSYLGIDVNLDMIRAARKRHLSVTRARFINSTKPDQRADYGVASGIFNVRLERSDAEWSEYMRATIDILDLTSRSGFAFNCLTSYSDSDRKQDHLFYADPCKIFDMCKRRYSRDVALLHDYGLYEFTVLVRKA